MVNGALRHCDVCDREIAKGNRYVAALIEREHIPPTANIAKSGLTVDGMGNIRLDICLVCGIATSLSGEERIH